MYLFSKGTDHYLLEGDSKEFDKDHDINHQIQRLENKEYVDNLYLFKVYATLMTSTLCFYRNKILIKFSCHIACKSREGWDQTSRRVLV